MIQKFLQKCVQDLVYDFNFIKLEFIFWISECKVMEFRNAETLLLKLNISRFYNG